VRGTNFLCSLLAIAVLAAPASVRAQDDAHEDVTPRVLALSGAALGGLAMFFAFESQLAGAHEAPPSESRAGIATVFTVVSISSLVLAVAAIGVSVVMTLSDPEPEVAAMPSVAGPLTIDCPALSCLPEPSGAP
jgi:hypothetical protein